MTAQLSLHDASPAIILMPHQLEAVEFLRARKGALLADDMGLGKTYAALTAAQPHTTMVICPPSAMSVWEQAAISLGVPCPQIQSYGKLPKPNLKIYKRLDGKETKTVIARPMPRDMVLILDEAHALKNWKSQRSESVSSTAMGVLRANGQVWALTATPLLNHPMELWQILSLMNLAWPTFKSWGNFISLFGGKKKYFGGYEFVQAASNEVEIKRLLMGEDGNQKRGGLPGNQGDGTQASFPPILRRTKSEVLPSLPPKSHQTHNVTLPTALHKLSRGIDDDIRTCESVEDLQSVADIASFRKALALEKYKASLDLIESFEDSDTPIVVFSAHVDPIRLLGDRKGWGAITGEIGHTRRAETVAAFQAGKLKGIACTIAAGGVAITLTHATHAIFIDKEWTPALNRQAEDRIYRIGQTRGVVIHHIVSDHLLDFHVQRVLGRKEELVDGIFE